MNAGLNNALSPYACDTMYNTVTPASNVNRSELFATKGFTTLMHLKNIHIAWRTIHSAQV